MIDPVQLPLLMKAIDFVFEEGHKILEERREQVQGLVLIDPQVASVSTGDIFPMNAPLLREYIMSVYMAPYMLPNSQPDDF